jgi:hypothetical protein
MPVTQRFTPFVLADVDSVALNFSPAMATGDVLTSPSVSVDGGFTVGTPRVGVLDETTKVFTTNAAGTYVQVLLTATTVGTWNVTFQATITGGRLLHRTERADVVATRS